MNVGTRSERVSRSESMFRHKYCHPEPLLGEGSPAMRQTVNALS